MRRNLMSVCVALICISGASGAAWSDGYYPPYETNDGPVIGRAPSWSGFYIGAHLGGTWASSSAHASGVTLNDSWSFSPSGIIAGATLGYNWQTGPVVFGVEGDLGYLGLGGSGGYYVPFGYDASTTTDTDLYMSIRGRLGVLVNGWMLYGTAGWLGADTTVKVLEACDIFCTLPTVSGSHSAWRNGWTIGGGFEVGIEGPWTAKLEYLYYDLGTASVTTPATSGVGATNWRVDTDGSIVRAGINYRFGWLNFGQ